MFSEGCSRIEKFPRSVRDQLLVIRSGHSWCLFAGSLSHAGNTFRFAIDFVFTVTVFIYLVIFLVVSVEILVKIGSVIAETLLLLVLFFLLLFLSLMMLLLLF